MKNDLSLSFANELSQQVNNAFNDGSFLEKVTPVTSDLLKYWFTEPFIDNRNVNFHDGQRQAILNIIYLHEVLGVNNVLDFYQLATPSLIQDADLSELNKSKYDLPKYAVKMATGTGKTWVMHAIFLWQMLNALHEDASSHRYTSNFLIIAPGLIVYDRLLDAFKGHLKKGSTVRDISTNDFYRYEELFIPNNYREEVHQFIGNNTVSKEEGIGNKTTSGGLIAITNWHLFIGDDISTEESEVPEHDENDFSDILPVSPGLTGGNALDALDRGFLRGTDVEYLAELPSLMIINDEAHHIHETRVNGEDGEVEWQRGIDYVFQNKEKGRFQVDFSATPYVSKGSGKKKVKVYFPHIVIDFDLISAIRKGLVKSIALDKRQQLADLQTLDFKAVRDERGKVSGLSQGQRLMIRAGLTKLKKLEDDFALLETHKHPKMLIMCEDTTVSPYVVDFLKSENLNDDDIVRIDSNKKGEVKENDWNLVKERLFNIDQYKSPKIIVSVLMLREGFDVNNICVIVPLRASEAPILLEQIIGRGLRLMWREHEFDETKAENRLRLLQHKSTDNYIDVLSIVEHPAFDKFYDELLQGGLAGIDDGNLGSKNSLGDLIRVGLKDNYQDYDMFWPVIIKNAEEEITPSEIDASLLEPFTDFTLNYLREYLKIKGEVFVSRDITTQTTYGKYVVKGDLFTAQSYNEYLQKIIHVITNRMDSVGARTTRFMPTLQINQSEIARIIDDYIHHYLFKQEFDPFNDFDWKVLLASDGIVTQHIIKVMSVAIYEMQLNVNTSDAIVEKHWFSSVDCLHIRKNYALALNKIIYESISYPSHNGIYEKNMCEFLDCDGDVEKFLKINETQHSFASLMYIRTDGMMAVYHPDFIVCTNDKVYILETKAENQINNQNVRQKQRAVVNWCDSVNRLSPDNRMNRTWEYILLGETNFYTQRGNGATFTDICRLNHVSEASAKGNLF